MRSRSCFSRRRAWGRALPCFPPYANVHLERVVARSPPDAVVARRGEEAWRLFAVRARKKGGRARLDSGATARGAVARCGHGWWWCECLLVLWSGCGVRGGKLQGGSLCCGGRSGGRRQQTRNLRAGTPKFERCRHHFMLTCSSAVSTGADCTHVRPRPRSGRPIPDVSGAPPPDIAGRCVHPS